MRPALLNENADLAWQSPRYVMRITSDAPEGIIQRGNFIDFADPDFDGEAVQIHEPGEGNPVTLPDDVPSLSDEDDDSMPPEPGEDETIVYAPPPPNITLSPGIAEVFLKYYINDESVTVLVEQVEHLMKMTLRSLNRSMTTAVKPSAGTPPASSTFYITGKP